MSERQQVKIKAKCNGVIRILNLSTNLSFKGFCDLLKSSFGISQCELQYNDEEGDVVELGSQDELQEALKVGEKFGPLKITIITSENPTMSAMKNKPVDCVQSSASEEQPPAVTTKSEDNGFVQSMSTLMINERPTPKPRPSRKKIGFYTSLCSDAIADLEASSGITANDGQSAKPKIYTKVENEKVNGAEDGQSETQPKRELNIKKSRKPKREPKLRGSKYYSSLASDIANEVSSMRQAHAKDVQLKTEPAVEKIPKRNKEGSTYHLSSANDVAAMAQDEIDKVDPKEKIVKRMGSSTGDDEPPKWFEKVVSEMSQSVSSQVIGALNEAMIPTVNGCSVKPVKRKDASRVHEGITCNGCMQVIVGPRYKCGNCPDYDLCEQCEDIKGIHDKSHVFVKLRYPGTSVGRKHGVMIPLLKDIIYKSRDALLAEEQDKQMKEVRKKLKQLAKKKREEQVRLKKADKKMKKLKGASNTNENPVCSFDYEFLGDESYPDGTTVTQAFEFTKSWKIRNTGNISWNSDTKLIYVNGGMRRMSSDEVPMPHLLPGEEGTVNVTFVAPAKLGECFSVWRPSHNGKNFGGKMWCKIKVVKAEVYIVDELLVEVNDDSTIQVSNDQAPMLESEEIPQISEEPTFPSYPLQEQGSQDGITEVASDNQAASMSDISLVDGTELEWDTCLIDDNSPRQIGSDTLLVNEDDDLDVEVISNASSDDYCVVPLPACFDPDIPLNIEDFSQRRETSLSQEMDPGGSLRSLVDYEDPMGYEEEGETLETEPAQDETVDNENESELSEEDVRIISNTAEHAASPKVDVPQSTKSSSVPVNIEVKSAMRSNTLSMPSFDVRTPINKPVAPQSPFLERTPLIPGRLPASPPGRAVPVVQTQNPEPSTACSVPDSCESSSAGRSGENPQWQAVRTQPPDNMVLDRSISEESAETVTIQPGTTAQSCTTQTTAQYASTLVTGTLKRAYGTVHNTVSSFMTGKHVAVVYSPGENAENVHVEVVLPESTEHAGEDYRPDTRVLQGKLVDMGFGDRRLNERLLKKYNMDVSKVITELLHETDNDWTDGRH